MTQQPEQVIVVTEKQNELGAAIRETAQSRGLPPELPYDLGVLLVHGIGEQQRGDTLTEVGDLLLEWLARRAEATGSAADVDLNLMNVVDRQASRDQIPSAHALIRITPPTKSATPANWVVAESFWADVFRPATFTELASWGVFIGPWAFAAQARGIFQRMETAVEVPNWLRPALLPIIWTVAGAMFLVGAFVALAVTVLALSLVILALTNLPFVADFARSTQRTLANGVGDAYVLTRSPIRFGAMASQVRADLEDLSKQSRAVAVIAHSQGTAVAWHAIKHGLTDDPATGSAVAQHLKLFLTYGQAVRKLTFMNLVAEGSQTRNGILALVGAGSGLLALAEFFVVGPGFLMLITVALAIAAEARLLARVWPVWKESQVKIEGDWDRVHAAAPGLEWLDLWASADPVPGGPLDVDRRPNVRTYKIRNLASGILDHVVYWKNGTEFLAVVLSRLFKLGGPRSYASELTDPVLLVSVMRRHARVLLLLAMRVVVAGAAVAGALQAWWTPAFSAGVMTFLRDLHLPLIGSFFDSPPDWTRSLAGVILVLIAAVLTWLPFAAVWSSLAAADQDRYFEGIMKEPLWDWRWWTLAGAFAAVAAGAGLLLVVLGAPALAAAYALATGFATLLALAVLSSGGNALSDADTPEDPLAAVRRVTGRTATSVAATLAGAVIIVAIPLAVAWFRNAALGPTLAVEAVVLSGVLLLEGAREYRRFSARFNAINNP
jgi:hypothetical protein